ncbi:MAG TPA: DinB family protein [Myxococcaceae bacterium]|nr:DinB family protein [Myxococcaceae bacterium]
MTALGAAGGARRAPPPAQVVSFTAADGTVLKASYFSPGRPGPGVLLFHQSNRDRKAWAPVARALAAAGVHTLTLDLRGFGDSDGTRYATVPRQEIGRARAPWPEDIELAWRFLVSRPDVDGKRIGLGGAGVDGVGNSVETARRHPGEVRSLVLLSGETLLPGLRFLRESPDLPAFCVVSDDDEYPPTVEAMELLYQALASPAKKLIHYPGRKAPWLWFEPFDIGKVPATGGHGTDLFKGHPELPGAIAEWFVTTLVTSPGRAPADTLGSWTTMEDLQSPGGVARVREQLERTRRRNAAAQLFPEAAVSIVGNDRLRASEPQAAVEIFELNQLAYPESADAQTDLADGYLANGRPDLARQHAQAALALLDAHAVPASSWSDTEPRRGIIREDAQRTLEKASATPSSMGAAQADAGPARPSPPATLAAAVDREISRVEEQVLAAAEAMPEDRFDFSPERLRIAGSAYQGVRTFAVQVRHIAASNYFLWSSLTGEPLPEGLKDGEGPADLRTRAEILAFLRRSFALGHRAAASLTPDNMLQPAGSSTRLQRATFAVAHAFDHYGQMVEYLRMNGVVPPATRAQSH